MIKCVRVDHRLLHGQVAFSWTKFLDADCILIASDNLMNDELKMSAIRLAKPTGVKLVMKSMQDSIKALNSGITDKYNLFIIIESIEDVFKLTNEVAAITSVNIGGMKNEEDRKQLSKAVYVSAKDIELIKIMSSKNIELEVRLVPSETKKNIMDLIKGE